MLSLISKVRVRLAVLLGGALVTAADAETTRRTYLSGEDAASPVSWQFLCTAGRNSGEWSTIPVPSLWDMEGFGTLDYGHDRPPRLREQGLYRHRFATPEGAAGRRSFLVFGGAMTDLQATLNGKPVGPVHRGGFFEFRHEVTDLLRRDGGENGLEVLVAKESEDPTVNEAERRADYWIFGGIFRPVWLETVPAVFIENVAVDAQADGRFRARALVNGAEVPEGAELVVDIIDAAGATVAGARAGVEGAGAVELATRVSDPGTWTAESPVLYTARFRLVRGEEVIHETRERFGFRTIELREGDGVYVNGSRVVFKGVNRHSFRPESGRALSVAQNRADAELLKEMNANAVRMSHYPPDSAFLEAADELGLYVINEFPGWQASYSTAAGEPLVREMVVRDRNHPSIIFWANGNEGGWNRELDDDFSRWDLQDRPLLHTFPGFHRGTTVFRGVNTKHYQDYEQFTRMLAGDDIVLPTEFLHGLYDGGHGAGLRDYWDAITASPVGAGGFLWVLADEGTRRTDEDGGEFIDVATNLAPDGLVGPHHEREGSFHTARRIFAPVQFDDNPPAGAANLLAVTNAYDFTNLREVAFDWELRQFPGAEGGDVTVIDSGTAASPDVAPGESGQLALELPSPGTANAVALSATGPDGRELGTWVWPLREWRPELPEARPADSATELVSGDVTLVLDPDGRTIRSVTREDRSFPLSGGPRLALGGDASGQLRSVRWSAAAAGWFRLEYSYEATGKATFAGITFDLDPTAVTGSRWQGVGPYRVWQNRLEGGTLGVWELEANDTITGWRDWIYPEFRGFFAGVRWMTLELADDGRIALMSADPELYVQRLTPSLPPQELQMDTRIELPDGDLSLLHVIPAIGTKFNAAHRLGPQSQPASLDGSYSGEVWFHFE